MEALRDFYYSTDGVNWDCHQTYGNPWIFSEHANPCQSNWTGVFCSYGPSSQYYHVHSLDFYDCSLFGTIPASIGVLTRLSDLFLSRNSHLTGTIPDVFAGMTNLRYLWLFSNNLYGEIPSSLAMLPNIELIDLDNNKLSGQGHGAFDPTVQTRLQVVSLYHNAFSGSLPDTVLQNTAVKYLNLEHNYFSGTLPISLVLLMDNADVQIAWNHLHGSIPDVFHGMMNLTSIDFSYNHLSGALPSSLALLPSVKYISLSGNRLSGRMSDGFNATAQIQLQGVALADNDFSGELPDVLFEYPAMAYINLQYNCFSGTLPETICAAVGLDWVELNCLSCSGSCTSRLQKGSYFLVNNPVRGTIPACLFSLPELNRIYLNDNYLTGSLPANLTIKSRKIAMVDLENNALTGTVPHNLLSSVPYPADYYLSNNRLTGTIPQTFTVHRSSAVQLSYNRLSGPAFGTNWPISVDVDVLTGNILGCDNGDRSRLPRRDVAYDKYSCGSDNFNKPIIAWLCVTGSLAVMCCSAWYWRSMLDDYFGVTQLTEKVTTWHAVLGGKHTSVDLPSLVRIRNVVILFTKVALAASVVALCVLAPIYAGLTASFGTYNHQYAWTVSAALLSGKVPFAVCFVVFLLSLWLSVGALVTGHDYIAVLRQSSHSVASRKTKPARILVASVLYVGINFTVVIAVNASYVATSLYTTAVYQLGISAFKVGWNLCIAPYLSRLLVYELSASRAEWFTLELFVSIMNNIGIPLLAMVVVSPQCLHHLLSVELIVGLGVAYNRPFYYSYQCSYAYMDFYASAFVYASLVASFGAPLLEQVLLQLHKRVPDGSVAKWCIDAALPRILKPVETDPDRIPDRSVLRPFFDTTQFLVAQLTSLALILTMGVVLPPLALPVAVTMVVSGYLETLKVGRLLTNASEQAQHKYADIIEQECANVATPTTMRRAFWMLLWFGCWFYTLFLFDILGEGWASTPPIGC
jgi:hypothetical protein